MPRLACLDRPCDPAALLCSARAAATAPAPYPYPRPTKSDRPLPLTGARRGPGPAGRPVLADSPVTRSVRASRHIVRGWAARPRPSSVALAPAVRCPRLAEAPPAGRTGFDRPPRAAADSILGFSAQGTAPPDSLFPFVFLLSLSLSHTHTLPSSLRISDSNSRRIGRTDTCCLLTCCEVSFLCSHVPLHGEKKKKI